MLNPAWPQDQAHARASHMYCIFLWSVGEPLRAYLTAQACSCRDRLTARCSHGSALDAPSSNRRLMACLCPRPVMPRGKGV